MQRFTLRATTLILFETCLLILAVSLAAYVRLGDVAWAILVYDNGFAKAILVAGVFQACLYYADLYNLRVVSDRRELFIRIVQAIAAASFILAVFYFWFPALIIGRGVFLVSAVLAMFAVAGWRFVFEWLSGRLKPRERLLLVGTSAGAVTLARELFERRFELGVEIVGFIDTDPARVGAPLINPGIIGAIDDIPSIVAKRRVDRVCVSLADARGKLPMDKLLEMKLDGVSFDYLASLYEKYTGKIAIENLRPSWFIFSEGFRKGLVLSTMKRTLDVVVASVGLIIGAPLMALIALAVRATSPGPALYHQKRVGLQGREFMVHKFRSMRQDAEAATGAVWASKSGDARLTRIGGWLRRTRMDELPQLWMYFAAR